MSNQRKTEKSKNGQKRFNFLLSKLNNVSVNDKKAKASCPAHKDQKTSLDVTLHHNDKISIKCHARCDYRDILNAVNIKSALLYPDV